MDTFKLIFLSCIFNQVQARILHINPQTKQVGVSLLPELLEFPEVMQQEKLAIGKIETCEVLKADSKSGLLVKLPDGSKGHVHVSI